MGNKRDHLMDQMDLLTSPYSDFIMDDREMLFHSIAGQVSSFHDDDGKFGLRTVLYHRWGISVII